MYRIRIPIAMAMFLVLGAMLYADYRLETEIFSLSLLALLVATALYELLAILGLPRRRNALAVAAAVLLLALRYLGQRWPGALPVDPVPAALSLLAILFYVPWLLAREAADLPTAPAPALPPGALAQAATVALGFFYVAFLLSYLLEIRMLRIPGSGLGQGDGILLVFFVIVAAKGADMGGYLVGKRFGRHKILPRVSPKKSVEGTLAGLALSAGLCALMTAVFPPIGSVMGPLAAAAFGLVAALLSLAGDLVESSVKRRVGVKDSSRLIPEYGGILDLMDSLMFASPAGYYFLHFLLGRM